MVTKSRCETENQCEIEINSLQESSESYQFPQQRAEPCKQTKKKKTKEERKWRWYERKWTQGTGFIKGGGGGCLKVCLKCRTSQKCVSQSKRRAKKGENLYYQYGVVLSRTTAKVRCDRYQKEENMHKPWRVLWLYQNRSCRPSLVVTEWRNMTMCVL